MLHGASAFPLAVRFGAYATGADERTDGEPVMDLPVRVRHTDP